MLSMCYSSMSNPHLTQKLVSLLPNIGLCPGLSYMHLVLFFFFFFAALNKFIIKSLDDRSNFVDIFDNLLHSLA